MVRTASGVIRRRKEVRTQVQAEVSEALKKELQPLEFPVQYIQSVLVWNLPLHLLFYMLLGILGRYYLDIIIEHTNPWQVMGVCLMLLGVVPVIRSRFARKGVHPPLFLWPEDAIEYSAEYDTLSLKTFTGKVKLYNFDELMYMLGEWKTNALQALYVMRLLRFTEATTWTLNLWFLSFFGAFFLSTLRGTTLIQLLFFALLLLPGIRRRRVFRKIGLKLLTKSWGQRLIHFLWVENNLNLNESNTGSIVTFLNQMDKTKTKKAVIKVVSTEPSKPNISQRSPRLRK